MSTDLPHDAPLWIDAEKVDDLQTLMLQRDWLSENETIASVSRAGEGNMNLTLRVTIQDSQLQQRTIIVKQSRPWVEKYPTIEAPVERATFERRFYLAIEQDTDLCRRMPRVVGHYEDQFLLALEDLGPAQDATKFYQPSKHLESEIASAINELVPWLARLHRMPVSEDQRSEFQNQSLRKLNHDYIFVLPFSADQGFNLDDVTAGLEQVAQPLRENNQMQRIASELGKRYLGPGRGLIHGDFFPGSWLRTDDGLQVIDPEFCHFGLPEFDLGVMIGHLRLTHLAQDCLPRVRESYRSGPDIDWALVEQFASIEVLRRLLGLAQLPLSLDLEQKKQRVAAAVDSLTRC